MYIDLKKLARQTNKKQRSKLQIMLYDLSGKRDREELGRRNIDVGKLTKAQIDEAYDLMNNAHWKLVEALENVRNYTPYNKDAAEEADELIENFSIDDLEDEDDDEEFGYIGFESN